MSKKLDQLRAKRDRLSLSRGACVRAQESLNVKINTYSVQISVLDREIEKECEANG